MSVSEEKNSTLVLDFDALVRVKRTVKIKGVHYELLDPEIYGIEQQTGLLKTRKLFDQLRNNPNKANIEAYTKAQDEFVLMVVPSLKGNPVFNELPYQFKEAIIETFFGLVLALKYEPKIEEVPNSQS